MLEIARSAALMDQADVDRLLKMLDEILVARTPGSKVSADLWELLDAAEPFCGHYAQDAWRASAIEYWPHRCRWLGAVRPIVAACLSRAGPVRALSHPLCEP